MAETIGRRSFIRSATAVSVGFAAAHSAFGQSSNDAINVALIGAGLQGQELVGVCMKMGKDSGIRFKAVCDVWEELNLKRMLTFLERFGHEVNGYVDYRTMLDNEKDLDAVIIATPDDCHAEQTVACLNAGLDVYCESPMSNTLEGAAKMVETAKKTGKLLQIGYQRRSNPRYIHCYDNLIMSAKILGKITAINGQWNLPGRPDRGWSRRREVDAGILAEYGYSSMHEFKNWMWYDAHSGGPAAVYGSHQIDVFNWFLGGVPKTVTARGATSFLHADKHERHDTIMAILEYETAAGLVSALYQTISSNGFGGHYEAFMGDQGTLKMSLSRVLTGVYHDPEAADWERWLRLGLLSRPDDEEEKEEETGLLDVQQTKPPKLYQIPVQVTDSYYKAHLDNFFDAVRGKGKLTCPAELGFAATVAALKINESVATGKSIALTEKDFEA